MNGLLWPLHARSPADQTMNVGVIDIGTNTVLLLIAQCDRSGNITPVVYEQRVPRLGKGVDAQKRLQPESMQRVLQTLREYKNILNRYHIEEPVVCGTSAVRDALNKQDLVTLVQRELGLRIEILSGKEEALWTYRGAISGVPDVERATVLDIGGGSTEITYGKQQAITSSFSIDIGSVRLTERFFLHDPPTEAELETADLLLEAKLAEVQNSELRGSTLIGVAGTATSLAVLAQGLPDFTLAAVTNYILRIEKVRSLLNSLKSMPVSAIRELSAMLEGRSDIITAGTMILYKIMTRFSFDEVIVSERGVRYGLALREWEKQEVGNSA